MRKDLFAFSIIAMAALLINGCVTAKKEKVPKVSFEDITGRTVTVETGGWHEDCNKLAAGDTLNLSFKSSKPGLYDIHYHRRNEKHDLKNQALADGFKGSFQVEAEAVYCFMFLNKNPEPVTLTYDMSVEGR